MVVRDVTDFCFHSYFSFMDELSENMGDDETPFDIKYVITIHLLRVSVSPENCQHYIRSIYLYQKNPFHIYLCFVKVCNWVLIVHSP
jgi:hypothetical protein